VSAGSFAQFVHSWREMSAVWFNKRGATFKSDTRPNFLIWDSFSPISEFRYATRLAKLQNGCAGASLRGLYTFLTRSCASAEARLCIAGPNRKQIWRVIIQNSLRQFGVWSLMVKRSIGPELHPCRRSYAGGSV
jgi:hypothetical protein